MIDGCTRIGALWNVVIPLTAPGVFTAGILAFVNAWDEFLLALTLSPRVSSRTLPMGITLYQGRVLVPVADHLGCPRRGDRADLRSYRGVSGSGRRRAHAGGVKG